MIMFLLNLYKIFALGETTLCIDSLLLHQSYALFNIGIVQRLWNLISRFPKQETNLQFHPEFGWHEPEDSTQSDAAPPSA